MRLFLDRSVARFVRRERIPDDALCRVGGEVLVGRLGAGEADLGNGLFKKRVARADSGKRDGYRMIVAYRPPQTERVLIVFAFAKSAFSDLRPESRDALAADDVAVAALLADGELREVMCDANTKD